MSCKRLFKMGALSAVCLGTVLTTQAYAAGTQNVNIAVTAAVESSCTLSTTALVFPPYTGAAVVDTTATLSVTCTNQAPYTLSLGAGNGAGATTAVRKLTSALTSSTLNYGLYQDESHTTSWGNTAPTDTVAGIGSGALQNVTVYGEVMANQLAPQVATDYIDTVAMTVTY